ncbi:MAG: HlyD family efflux transporter periplasmic adaptor subunit [Prevotellaceae bacterium]|nr:HlyD family efflux transporter periplasmic adaptor subunit [Prevotellaceae bacterium]
MKRKVYSLLAMAVMMSSCGDGGHEFDATGVFESTEITVSAEQNGRIMSFSPVEGDVVRAGEQVALIDTVQLYLNARRIGAAKLVYASQRPETEKQIAATREQLAKARQDYDRFRKLVADGAANRKTADDAQSQVRVLERQLSAQLSQLNNSTNSLNAQMSTADIERMSVADMLRKCHVVSPITGTILEKYAEAGEFAITGKPLFKIADTGRMYLRAYVTSRQLKDVRIGQKARVFADYGDGQRREYAGRVTWIASKAEFTPKTILTDDERADLVYAVKIEVRNDGYVKIGMYGEVIL